MILFLNNIDADMNAESEIEVFSGNVELAFAGVGNFLMVTLSRQAPILMILQVMYL